MKTAHRFAAIAALAAYFAAPAAAQVDEKYYTVDEASVKIESAGGGAARPLPAFRAEEQGPIADISKVVNLMEKVFDIISKNQPVIDISTKYANAVPAEAVHWTYLQGWKRPSVRKYSFTVNNALGGRVAKVDYQVHWAHGGNYRGKGLFLTGVTVEPISVMTVAGYKVSLAAEIPDSTVMNVGTHEDPVAAMQVKLRWTIHTAVKEIKQQAIYYVQGDGYIEEIGTPFENARAARGEALLAKYSGVSFD